MDDRLEIESETQSLQQNEPRNLSDEIPPHY